MKFCNNILSLICIRSYICNFDIIVKSIKLVIAALALFAALPQPVKALPFRQNCASMQHWMNTRSWNTPTKFSGMENSVFNFYGYESVAYGKRIPMPQIDSTACDGYVTETSPLGTRVCKANIIWDTGYTGNAGRIRNPSGSWNPYNSGCRWK